ncbi:hypothetical protein ACEQ8H_003348 [Pleosporales sp. CAS-2024a]
MAHSSVQVSIGFGETAMHAHTDTSQTQVRNVTIAFADRRTVRIVFDDGMRIELEVRGNEVGVERQTRVAAIEGEGQAGPTGTAPYATTDGQSETLADCDGGADVGTDVRQEVPDEVGSSADANVDLLANMSSEGGSPVPGFDFGRSYDEARNWNAALLAVEGVGAWAPVIIDRANDYEDMELGPEDFSLDPQSHAVFDERCSEDERKARNGEESVQPTDNSLTEG